MPHRFAALGVALSLSMGCVSLTKPRYVTAQALHNAGTRASQMHNFNDEEQTAIVEQARKEGVSQAEVATRIAIHRKAYAKGMELIDESAKDLRSIAEAVGFKPAQPGSVQ